MHLIKGDILRHFWRNYCLRQTFQCKRHIQYPVMIMLVILISQMIVDLQKAEKLRGQNFALFASGFPASTAPLHCTLSTSALALYPLVHRTTLYPLVHWHCIHKCIAMYCIVSTIALTLYPFVLQALLKCTSLLNSKPPLPISKEENCGKKEQFQFTLLQ